MGMAASQVRLLTLQNRKSTIGLRLGMLSQREISLANKMDEVATEYTNALENKSLKWTVSTGNYVDITYDHIMTPMANINQCNPHILTDRNGKVVLNSEYNDIVTAHPDIFGPNVTGKPSVRPAVIDFVTQKTDGTLSATGAAFTRNDVTDTEYREAKIHEVFDYLAQNLNSIDDSVIKDKIQLIIKNYKENIAGYAERGISTEMPPMTNPIQYMQQLSQSEGSYSYTNVKDQNNIYTDIANMLNEDSGVKALRFLAAVEGFDQYSQEDIQDSVDRAIEYFSKASHVTGASISNANPVELANEVNGYMGTKVSDYYTGYEYKTHLYNAAFSYREFYDYVLSDLAGHTNPFASDGNTETNLKIINEKPATVTIPSIEDMAMNILTVAKQYAGSNNNIKYSDALNWLNTGIYFSNSKSIANLNYYMEQYLNGDSSTATLSTIQSLYQSVSGNGNLNMTYLTSLDEYDNKTFSRNDNSTVVEYWQGVTQDEIDFYTAVFEKIRDNGYTYSQNGTEKDYLNLMLQNNMYLIDDMYAQSCSKIAAVCINQTQQEEALSKYEAQLALINEKEEDVQLEMEKLNTEYTMIKSEISSIKQIIDDNIKSTFKINT